MAEYIEKQAAIEVARENGKKIPTLAIRTMEAIKSLPAADVAEVVRCKYCIHNNACYIQYSAQAGDNFFCGFGETEKDVREDVYE